MFGHLYQWVSSNFFSEFFPNNGSFMHCHLLPQVNFPCDRKLLFDITERYFDEFTEEKGLNLTLRNDKIAPTHIIISITCSALTVNESDI